MALARERRGGDKNRESYRNSVVQWHRCGGSPRPCRAMGEGMKRTASALPPAVLLMRAAFFALQLLAAAALAFASAPPRSIACASADRVAGCAPTPLSLDHRAAT